MKIERCERLDGPVISLPIAASASLSSNTVRVGFKTKRDPREDASRHEGSVTKHLYAAGNTVAVKFCAFDYIGTACGLIRFARGTNVIGTMLWGYNRCALRLLRYSGGQ